MKFSIAFVAVLLVSSASAIENLASAFRICAIQYGGGDINEQFRLQRMQLIDQEKDHCYAKCLWTTSEQFNPQTNAIDVSKVIQGLTSQGFSVPQHLIELQEPTDGSCKAMFEKTRAFIEKEFSSYQYK